MQTGNFDMLINNYGSGISGSPYSYWNWVANHNIHREYVTETSADMTAKNCST